MNWKTTTLGVATIVSAISTGLMLFLKTGQIPELGAIVAAITAGVGLILAKDATK
jgi:hypothetical protein